jgi:hypothetical protein
VPLEVHLPEVVRLLCLEALPVADQAAVSVQELVAPQDAGDRRGCRDRVVPQRLKPVVELAATPGWMLETKLHHLNFQLSARLGR